MKIIFLYLSAFIGLITLRSCNQQNKRAEIIPPPSVIAFDTTTKTIHVFVALCDNKYQGIVPVPAKIGNGQDAINNLYWGNDYGVKTYFKRSGEWHLLSTLQMNNPLIERIIFKNTNGRYYLVADAWNGKYIKQTTKDFLKSCAGLLNDTLHIGQKVIGINGNAALLAYVGHDGLMDFWFDHAFKNTDQKKRSCIILACYSKKYFEPFIKAANAAPLVWTTGLMCPEAYTLHDAVATFVANKPPAAIRNSAALAYDKYQKCGLTFAKNLLVTGWSIQRP
jgi:hypothetical protein